jgi:hypothetical protein
MDGDELLARVGEPCLMVTHRLFGAGGVGLNHLVGD